MLLGNYFQNISRKYKKIFFSGISFNSKQIKKNYIFFAIKGNQIDGNNFISIAIKKGSKIIVTERKQDEFQNGILFIHTKNIRKLLAEVSFRINHLKPKNLVSVTGTNGKSSVADYFYQILNFNKIKVAYNAGDPINTKIFNFYRALGINLKPLYLQAESSGYVCLQSANDVNSDSVGHPASDVELRINDKEEIEYRTTSIFSGYFKDKTATTSVLSKDGWFKSGDTGEFLENGSLKLIGRVDEVGTTTKGTKVHPQYIENQLRLCTLIKNAVVFGYSFGFFLGNENDRCRFTRC
mgnify:CR=1 FL=1